MPVPFNPDAEQGDDTMHPQGNDRPTAVQMSVKAGSHQNHAREARLGHHPLFSRAGGGRSMYSPMLFPLSAPLLACR
jgi:hypothetical protein